jgi:plasmid maintenance system antidote protein VapI
MAYVANEIELPIKTINEIISGNGSIDSDISFQLERALGVASEFWTQREASYQFYLNTLRKMKKSLI